MSDAAKKLLEAPLKLSEQERMALVASISASLTSAELDSEWADELEARAEQMLDGSDSFSMDEALSWAADPNRK